ncbi:MAG: hypothetical protein GY787_25540 [Alteromonadales bacterium]|nr:hypothetical protein [Alteromonadales bacterium]
MQTKSISSIIFAVACSSALALTSPNVMADNAHDATEGPKSQPENNDGYVSKFGHEGTPGLTGTHIGQYRLFVHLTNGHGVLLEATEKQAWFWDFDNKEVTFGSGKLRTKTFPYPSFDYEIPQPVSFVDNGDGSYTVEHGFELINWPFGNTKALTTSHFKITKFDGNLHFEVLDIEGNGQSDGITGTQFLSMLPEGVQLEWRAQ